MKFNKKAELDEIVLVIGLVIAIIIVIFWFIFFISNQSIQKQDLIFQSLNQFSANYELVLNGQEARIESIEIVGIEDSVISVNKQNVCIESKNFVKNCYLIISNSANFEGEFVLDDLNYFNFIKNSDGTIIIEKMH